MTSLDIMQPADFFRTKVSKAADDLNVRLDTDLEYYLVNLLCDFINPSPLNIDENIEVLDTPLAIMLKKALESSIENRIKVFKRLGDTSLYFAGYFQDYFNRKTYDVSYYINMGMSAYEQTSHLMRSHKNDRHFATIYSNLAVEFKKLVAILSEISETAPHKSHKDLLSTYQKWQVTQSASLRKILEEEGILPIAQSSREAQ